MSQVPAAQEAEIFTHIFSNDEDGRYTQDVLIDAAKIRELKNKSRIDLSTKKEFVDTRSLFARFKPTRKNVIYFGKFEQEIPVRIEEAIGTIALSLISGEDIAKRIAKMSAEHRRMIGYITIGSIQIVVRGAFNEGIHTPITLAIVDNRIRDSAKDSIIGAIKGDLGYQVIKFTTKLQFPIPLLTRSLNQSIGLVYKFDRQTMMGKGDMPMTVTYGVGYALSNSSHSVHFRQKETIEIDDLFKETSTRQIPLNKNPLPQVERPLTPSFRNFRTMSLRELQREENPVEELSKQLEEVQTQLSNLVQHIGQ